MRRSSACLLVLGIVSVLMLGSGLWMPAKAWLAQVLLAQAWAQTDPSGEPRRPWPWADTWPVAQLHFPGQNQRFIVLHGTSGASLPFGPGHLSASAAPGGTGTVVIAGHRDTHFQVLEFLQKGDLVTLEQPDSTRLRYRIDAIEIVDSDTVGIALDPDRNQLVLITCFPFGVLDPGGPLRYVVTAGLAGY